jgi:hypothetical protein
VSKTNKARLGFCTRRPPRGDKQLFCRNPPPRHGGIASSFPWSGEAVTEKSDRAEHEVAIFLEAAKPVDVELSRYYPEWHATNSLASNHSLSLIDSTGKENPEVPGISQARFSGEIAFNVICWHSPQPPVEVTSAARS